jgi:glycerophosphoryl diester phosphodiesterase
MEKQVWLRNVTAMRNTKVIVLVCSFSLSLFSCRSQPAAAPARPLVQAHAHNDYKHDRPLYDALAHGFTGVEADIFLVDGDLYVAHDRDEITPERTLRRLYLDPLRERVTLNGGSVCPDTGASARVTLLIDIKSDAVSTYKVLDRMLAEYHEVFTSFGPAGRTDKAVLAVVSGNRPYERMAAEKVRYAGYDGRLTDLKSDVPADLMPLISDNWTSHFTWRGLGEMPEAERRKLREIVRTAHQKGRRVRFWATPDEPSPAREAIWRELLSAGVDMLNTDDLEGLQQFLLAEGADANEDISR